MTAMKKIVEHFVAVGGLMMPTWVSKLIVASLLSAGCAGIGMWIGSVNTGISAATKVDAVQNQQIAETNTRVDKLEPVLIKLNDAVGELNRQLAEERGRREGAESTKNEGRGTLNGR